MADDAPKPFLGYDFFGPYLDTSRKQPRYKVFLRSQTSRSDTKTFTLARYRMAVKLGRILSRTEEVDHVDEDPLNDDLSNLQILTRKENTSKGSKSRGQTWVKLKCPECSKIFHRNRRFTHLCSTARDYSSCSIRCGNLFRCKLLKDPEDQGFQEALNENVVETYKKVPTT